MKLVQCLLISINFALVLKKNSEFVLNWTIVLYEIKQKFVRNLIIKQTTAFLYVEICLIDMFYCQKILAESAIEVY